MDTGLPSTTVENREFVKLLKLLQPRYRPVLRQTIQRRILEYFKIQRTRIMDFLVSKSHSG